MKFKKLPMILALAGIFFVSCEKEELQENEEVQVVLPESKLSPDVLNKIASLHFNPKGAELSRLLMPDGSYEKTYLVEGDIAITAEQLENMSPDEISSKQYRTFNLVYSPRTVNVIGYTGGDQALSSKQRTALQWTIDNYNALNLGVKFTLTFGTSYSSYDIVVYQNKNGEAGGVAGFPSDGNPYKYVQIFSGMENYDTNTNEHVITHEIGHAVGLRHTDWFSRQSCGQSGESAGSDGAVHIPGTPSGFDSNSIMLACFGSSEDGEFGYYDRVALNYLY